MDLIFRVQRRHAEMLLRVPFGLHIIHLQLYWRWNLSNMLKIIKYRLFAKNKLVYSCVTISLKRSSWLAAIDPFLKETCVHWFK